MICQQTKVTVTRSEARPTGGARRFEGACDITGTRRAALKGHRVRNLRDIAARWDGQLQRCCMSEPPAAAGLSAHRQRAVIECVLYRMCSL
ncbi:MAG: hypothetical protein ACK55Z_34855, partial [bacterium]